DVLEVADRRGDDVEDARHQGGRSTASYRRGASRALRWPRRLAVLETGGGCAGGVESEPRAVDVVWRPGAAGPRPGLGRGRERCYADCSFCSEMRMGRSLFKMTSRVMMHSLSPGMDGSSYIISSMTSSSTARSPRAPVPRFIASRATAATA